MLAVKKLAACIGVTGEPLSILKDFFGYAFHGHQGPIALRQQLLLLKGKHIHLNVIRVGTDGSGALTSPEEEEIDAAVEYVRKTYATVGLGIGRVKRYFITEGESEGLYMIGDDCDASDLWDTWTVDNDSIDVFFVRFIVGPSLGKSPTPGPCDKDDSGSGVIIALEETFQEPNLTGYDLAHEIGHHLGLPHVNVSNLMMPTAPTTVPVVGSLTAAQGTIMRAGCFSKPGC